MLLAQWLATFFVLYILLMIGLRVSSLYKFSQCPNCGGELKRSQRKGPDKMINSLSLGILPVKRYRCYTCYWEGLAFAIPKDRKNSEIDSVEEG